MRRQEQPPGYRMLAICACIAASAPPMSASAQHQTRQMRACQAWHNEVGRALAWSEQYRIHTPEMRSTVRLEAEKLNDRCRRDLSAASLQRYSMLLKLLHDDEADEVESFD